MEQTEIKEKITEILKTLGLSKNEIVVYLNLISSNNSSALEIAKRTGIHRSNTYDALRKLIERGFVLEVKNEDKTLFQAISPEKIKDYMRQKEQELDILMPNLKLLGQTISNQNDVSLSQGVFALRQAVLDLLELNSPISVLGASGENVKNMGEGFLKDFHKERIKRKILMRHIYGTDSIARIKFLNTIKYTDARFLPEKYNTIACTTICKDRVLFFIFGKPILIIKINNAEIAKAYENYFELFWKKAKKL